MRAQFRYAMRHDPESVRILARRFSTTIRRKCRQYRQRQIPALLRHLRSNHECFWQKLNPVGGALPAALANHSAWEAFHQGLCAPPTVNLQPPSVQHPCTIPSSAALDADITEREVELALPKLSNGKAVGGAGWPAELLSCCNMLHIMLPWKMAAVTRSGSQPRFSPSSSTAASTLVHCRLASPQHSSPQSTKRAAPFMPPTTGP